jgi:hypothetical protein
MFLKKTGIRNIYTCQLIIETFKIIRLLNASIPSKLEQELMIKKILLLALQLN